MFLKLFLNFLLNEKKAASIIFFTNMACTGVIATMLSLSLDIENKLQRELRSFGANIIVEPEVKGLMSLAGQPRYLQESDIPKIKTIFWRHNIIGIAPFLEATVNGNINGKPFSLVALGTWFEKDIPVSDEGGSFRSGIFSVASWWYIEGKIPKKGECLAGTGVLKQFGLKIGDMISIGRESFRISGVLSTGSREDDMIIMELEELQRLTGLKGLVSSIWISALTTPMDDFAYKDPATMTPAEYEKWYCTGYVTSIAKQIQEVIRDSSARPVWKVAEAEGNVLNKLKLAIYLLSAVTLVASTIGVASTMMRLFLKRTREIGLMKAIGGGRLKISILLLSGVGAICIISSLSGFGVSLFLSHHIGVMLFGTALENKAILFPVSLLNGVIVCLLGAWIPLRNTLAVRPAVVLKGVE